MKKANTLSQCFDFLQDNNIISYRNLKFKLQNLEPYGGIDGEILCGLQERFGVGNTVLLNVYHDNVELMLTIEISDLGNTVRYFKNVRQPITVNRLLRALDTGYIYNQKQKVLVSHRTRCVYNEGEIKVLNFNPQSTFDYILKSFKDDLELLGIYTPKSLQSELAKLKGKAEIMPQEDEEDENVI